MLQGDILYNHYSPTLFQVPEILHEMWSEKLGIRINFSELNREDSVSKAAETRISECIFHGCMPTQQKQKPTSSRRSRRLINPHLPFLPFLAPSLHQSSSL